MNHQLLTTSQGRCYQLKALHQRKTCKPSVVFTVPQRQARSGLFLQDLFVALILMSVMIACLVPMFTFVARSRRLAYQEQVACQMAANCLDEIVAAKEADREALHRLFEQKRSFDELPAMVLQPEVALSLPFRERFLASTMSGKLLPVATLQISRDRAKITERHDPGEMTQLEESQLEGWKVAIDWQITPGTNTSHQRHAPVTLTGWTPVSSEGSHTQVVPSQSSISILERESIQEPSR